MEPEREKETCHYLQTLLQLPTSFCETVQNAEFAIEMYQMLEDRLDNLQNILAKAYDEKTLRKLLNKVPPLSAVYLPGNMSALQTAEDLIELTKNKGYLLELIAVAHRDNPKNPPLNRFVRKDLKDIILQILPSEETPQPQPDGLQRHEQAMPPSGAGFERLGPEFESHQHCVCRIDVPGYKAEGTGFLVAEGMVITCLHVMKPVFVGTVPWDQVVVRFDYAASYDGKKLFRGIEYKLADNWQGIKNEQLDYILLPLNKTPISSPFLGGDDLAERRWLQVKSHSFQKDEEIQIIQHPLGYPLRISKVVGKVSRIYEHRVFYTTATDHGSSGAPCIIHEGTVVALHARGGPTDNDGISFSAIIEDLSAKFKIHLP